MALLFFLKGDNCRGDNSEGVGEEEVEVEGDQTKRRRKKFCAIIVLFMMFISCF